MRMSRFSPSGLTRVFTPRAVPALWLALAPLTLAASSPPDSEPQAPLPLWTVAERTVIQDQGHWQVEYRLRLEAPAPLILAPEDITAHLDAWVSNSRVPGHAAPRRSTHSLSGPSGLTATTDLLDGTDEARRCRERARLTVWAVDDPPPPPLEPAPKPKNGEPPVPIPAAIPLAPGQELRVRLRLEHEHFLHGPYDPLLGPRELTLTLGSTTFRDTLPLDRERYRAVPPVKLASPPADRLDTRYFVSGPDSLHLEAHVPGNTSYKLTEQAVRYATKMRLSYWYLIALGTEGECRVRLQQYRDAPNSWRVLSEGCRDEVLSVVGRWAYAEHLFRTEPEATSLAIDFRITGAEIGEMWIDDIVLEPLVGSSRP